MADEKMKRAARAPYAKRRGAALASAAVLGFTTAPARAHPGSPSAGPPDDEAGRDSSEEVDYASDVIDPTASLLQMTLMYEWVLDYRDTDQSGSSEEDGHGLVLRPAIPLSAFGLDHIFRLSVSYELDNPAGETGLSSAQAFDLVVFEQPWGRWGAGAVVNLESGGEDAEAGTEVDRFQLGPAIGIVTVEGSWTFGVFNQNLFSDEVQLSLLQPIVGYGISPMLSVSTGELELAWNWGNGELESLPIGVQVNVVAMPLGQPIRFFVNPQIDLIDEAGNERWSAIFGFAVLASAL